MKTTLLISVLLLFAPMTWCTTVTLENGIRKWFDKEIDVNQPALLTCNYSPESSGNSGKASVDWGYSTTVGDDRQKLIVLQGAVQDGYSPQFSLQPPASLQIQSALVMNAGFYECRVTIENDGVGKGTYNVTVLVPPSVPVCRFTSDYAITLGFSAEFKCHSNEGIPAPAYQWYKNGVALPTTSLGSPQYANTSFSFDPQTGTLTFAKVVKGDAGTYYCSATNKRGSEKCNPVVIKTKDQDIGMIVGIVFGVIFGLLLIGVLIWWTWKKGYCDGGPSGNKTCSGYQCYHTGFTCQWGHPHWYKGFVGKDDDEDVDGDDANDIMLDGNGPTVNKPPSEYNGSTVGKHHPDGAVRVMP